MSLSRTPSLNLIPAPAKQEPKDKETDADTGEKKSQTSTSGKEQKQNSTSGSTTKKKFAQASPPQKLNLPVVRNKLSTRERSVSSPLIIRPVSNPEDSGPSSSQTPDGKSISTSRRSKDADAAKQPRSSDASKPSKPQGPADLPSSPPKLRTKKPNPARKSLTPEQQLANDLADLMDRQLLRKAGRPDDEVAVNQMTASLQRYSGKPADAKVRPDELMVKMFSGEMKTSEGWEIASQSMVRIRSAYFNGRDENSILNEKQEKEANDMLAFLTAGFAGAFFNLSGGKGRNRLPEKLRFFLQAADHRQIRLLLSTDAGIRMIHEEFTKARKDWLGKVLLDSFLIPLILKEFSLQSGTIESSNTAAHIIQSLHAALSVSAPELLAESLKTPPDDVAELMLKRRSHQFRPRADKASDDTSQEKRKNYLLSGPSSIAKTSSINQQRRWRLKQILDTTITALAPRALSNDMLAAIKSFNNEFAASSDIIDPEKILSAWLDIARKIDAKDAAISALQEVVNIHIEQSSIEKELTEADVFTKLALIESGIQAPYVGRAQRMSSDQPVVLPSLATASTSHTPVSSSMTPPSASASPGQRKVPRSPASPSNRPVQHKRSKTADVVMPAEHDLASELTKKQREALFHAYPDLLLQSVMRATMRNTATGMEIRPDPLSAIWEVGRIAFSIQLKDIPLALRVKLSASPAQKKKDSSINHTVLLNLLTGDAVRASPAGKALEARRAEALRLAGKSLSVQELVLKSDQIEEKKSLNEKFQPLADSLVSDIFGRGLVKAGLPEELIQLCKDFDRKLTACIGHDLAPLIPTITQKDIDGLRSNLLFDLMLTRSVYPLLMSTNDPAQSVNATNFATAFRRSIKKLWDSQLFDDFKSMQAHDAANFVVATGSSGSSVPPSSAKQ